MAPQQQRTTLGRAAISMALALVVGPLQAPIAWSQAPGSEVDVRTPIDPSTDTEIADAESLQIESGQLDPNARRLKWSLAESLALSLQNNLDVEVARYEPEISEQDMIGAWGAYDPVLNANIGYELTESPVTVFQQFNPVDTARDRYIRGGAGVDMLLPYIGATIGVEMDTTRQQTNGTFQAFSPSYDSAVFLTASVPLLKGLIWNRPWTEVKIRKISYGSSLDDFRRSVMDVTESTINQYWVLVANQDRLRVARKSLETALALLDQTETQYEVGVVSKVDVVEAEAGVADREFNLIVTRNNLDNSADDLIDSVIGREFKGVMQFSVQATDDPEDYEVKKVDVTKAIDTAFANLPELKIADYAIDERKVELKFAKNARLPQLDVNARYGYVNASGDDNPRSCLAPPCGPSSHFDDSFDDFFGEDGFKNYSVTGVFSIPIPNTEARRNVTKREIELRRARSRKSRTVQDVIVSVRSAARGILASAQGVEAAERRRIAAAEQLRAERIRLEHGESTPFDVLQRESDLVEAESQKITALQAYRQADARLERAQGTILDAYGIRIDDVREDPMR